VTEFWRRWHISLTNWMREYLYIPLGGNRVGPLRTSLNLWTVFLLSGLWHGAAWSFVLWGAYHGLFLSLDRLFWSRVAQRLPRLLNVTLTFLVVCAGWLIFRSDDPTQAATLAARLVGSGAPAGLPLTLLWGDLLSRRAIAIFGVSALLCFGPLLPLERLGAALQRTFGADARAVLELAFSLVIFWLSTLAVMGSSFHPFIYFRF
jgi:alginate O-acetyltransferase complex protein AlgI